MSRPVIFVLLSSTAALLMACPPPPADPDDAGVEGEGEEGEGERVDAGPEPDPDAVGLDARPVNTTCVAPNRPVTDSAIQLTQVYPNLSLSQPLFVTEAPGDDDHFYAIQRTGRVVRWLKSDDAVTTPETYCNISSEVETGFNEQGLLGIAFSPEFATNHELYLSYTADNDNDDCTFANANDCVFESRVSRFTASANSCNEASEVRVIEVDDFAVNHNGGHILFGPDGYLYWGMGDGGNANDPKRTAEDVSSLLGKIMRIDVDVAEDGKQYGIPADNPFRNVAGARPEIYAFGLRNPWRFSFDRGSGELWVGDVGQNRIEEIDLVQAGGDYGWSVFEGSDCFNDDDRNPRGCDAGGFTAPVVEYLHGNGRVSVTGGYVYRGSAIPDAVGTYFFADFGSREIFRIVFDNQGAASIDDDLVTMTGQGVASFSEDRDGELYVVDLGGRLFRIDAAGPPVVDAFPKNLSETGCMDPADTTKLASGVIPYQIGHPFYSDGADKGRGVALPEGGTVTIGADGDMDLPIGTVFVKSFGLAGALIETRLLVRHDDGDWAGYSYEWNAAGTDARLVEAGGKSKTIGAQTWSYPSRAACLSCHTAAAGRSLGWEVGQLNSPFVYPQTGRLANQLRTLSAVGVFANPPADVGVLDAYPAVDLASVAVATRAETYLHVNCAMCHRPGGGGQSRADFRLGTAPADQHVCNETPGEGDSGVVGAKLIFPGDPARSMVSLRMHRIGAGRMPLLGSNVVDAVGTDVVDRYITGLTACP